MRQFLITMPVCELFHTVICIQEIGVKNSVMEFRGDGYQMWDSIQRSPAQSVHDALEGWHSCVLHAGDSLFLHEKHPDFKRICKLYEDAYGKRR